MRIHDLRHTAASLMLGSGATLDDVKRYLGHASIVETSDLYGTSVEGRSAEVASGIDGQSPVGPVSRIPEPNRSTNRST